MGNCLSSRKRGGNNNNHHHHANNINPFDDLLGNTSQSRSRHRNIPLDQRPDRRLKHPAKWTHDVASEGPAPSLKQLARMREEFWHTRVTGRQEVWQTIRTVVELLYEDSSDDALFTANEILHAAEITSPSGNLSHSLWDSLGNKYKLEQYVVSNPTNLRPDSSPRSSNDTERTSVSYKSSLNENLKERRKGKGSTNMAESESTAARDGKTIEVTSSTAVFLFNDGTRHTVEIWSDERIKDISTRVIELAGFNPQRHRARFFMNGRELDKKFQPLMSYHGDKKDWTENQIISVFVQDLQILAPHLVPLPVAPPTPTTAAPVLPPPQPQSPSMPDAENEVPREATKEASPPAPTKEE
ncbi:hypothetical protein ABW20_dc0102770 [Dactylellina cionopaga]|nr:hypothetical protein ABW20_dc0102770 [Dactylellina cionopaga]